MIMVSHYQTTTNTEKSKQFSAEANTSEVANFQFNKPWGILMSFLYCEMIQYELHFIMYYLKSYFISVFTNS